MYLYVSLEAYLYHVYRASIVTSMERMWNLTHFLDISKLCGKAILFFGIVREYEYRKGETGLICGCKVFTVM